MTKKPKRNKTKSIHRIREGASRFGIVALLLVSIGLQLQYTSAARSSNGLVEAYATNMSVDGLQSAQNAQRTVNGLPALALNSLLNNAAQAKANDMIAKDYWSHYTPSGDPPWVFIINAGYSYEKAGENLAYGFADSSGVVAGWMNSPTHRANVLEPAYTEVGFGIANGPNYQGGPNTVVVAMYAQPIIASTPVPSVPAPVTTPPPSVNGITTSPQVTATPAPTAAPAPVSSQPTTTSVPAETAFNSKTSSITSAKSEPESSPTTMLMSVLNGSASWQLKLASLALLLAAAWFAVRHRRGFKKAIKKGERYIGIHPFVEFVLFAAGAMLLVSTIAGVIK